jgi:hypothetical protein
MRVGNGGIGVGNGVIEVVVKVSHKEEQLR